MPVDRQPDSSLAGRFCQSTPPQANPCTRLTRVEEDQTVRADQVDTTSTSLTAQQENELLAIRVVELINQLLPLIDRHCAVETEVTIPIQRRQPSTGQTVVIYSLLATE